MELQSLSGILRPRAEVLRGRVLMLQNIDRVARIIRDQINALDGQAPARIIRVGSDRYRVPFPMKETEECARLLAFPDCGLLKPHDFAESTTANQVIAGLYVAGLLDPHAWQGIVVEEKDHAREAPTGSEVLEAFRAVTQFDGQDFEEFKAFAISLDLNPRAQTAVQSIVARLFPDIPHPGEEHVVSIVRKLFELYPDHLSQLHVPAVEATTEQIVGTILSFCLAGHPVAQ